MTIQEIANKLAEYCRKAAFTTAQKELFSENAVSIEPYATSEFEKETKGLQAIYEKGEKWDAMVKEMHSITVSEPLIASNSFAFTMKMDVTMEDGGKMDMAELCVYTVKDGKIISEQFYV